MMSKAPADHLVVLLHGLGRTRHSLARMDRALTIAGFTTLRLGYPSMRQPIEQHAAVVAKRLDEIPTPNKCRHESYRDVGASQSRSVTGFCAR